MALETRLAEGHWERAETRDVIKTYNLTTFDELRAARAGLRLVGLGRRARRRPRSTFAEVVVRQPATSSTSRALLGEIPLDDWKAWLAFHVVRAAAPYL